MIYFIIAIIIIVVYLIIIYNKEIDLSNKCKNAESVMDTYLQQRFDLIPNLVEIIKKYTDYEDKMLQDMTLLREEYLKNKNLKIAEKIENEYEKIMLKIEKYPDIKADELFIRLSKNLVIVENQIQAARRLYNYDVMKYNLLIKKFPNNILAKILKWNIKETFKIEKEAQESVNINI